jgi:hypothetical protein
VESISKIHVGAGGQLALSAEALQSAGFREGDVLLVRASDGEVQLLSADAAARTTQALVRKLVPEGVSLVDELLDQRRHEVVRSSVSVLNS